MPDGFSTALFDWLEHRGALGVVILWLVTLLRERSGLLSRSERLSDALCRAIESGSAERARMADEYRLGHDWTVRSLLDAFTALATRRASSELDMRPPKPRPPTSKAPSDSIPPPLPDAPPPPPVPKRRTT